MSTRDTPTSVNGENREDPRQTILLAEYERAQELAHHNNDVIYEVTAIVWSANTLLLGFVLEVPCESSNQKLVFVAALLGVFMSGVVPYVLWLAKKGQRIGFETCRAIEIDLALPHQLHNRISEIYPKRM